MALLECIEIEPAQPAVASVIWLHGLGASGHDFEPIVPELQLPADLPVRFIFPHAPNIPVTVNGGMVMPAWYDILAMDIDRKVDESGVLASADAIDDLIEREIQRGIPSNRIIIAGFSQGGAVAYQCALRHPKPLAGLLTLSTYMAIPVALSETNAHLPVMVSHGTMDPVVPEQLGQRAVASLQQMGLSPDYRTYPMEHMVCLEQIREIGKWISECLMPDA
ncbi:MAG: dienelactone hydrolase family protein [Pseudomonadota bacterium]|uniref:alpha/beta hydrolase n=1 Tax=Alcanivorax sp. TaxID=1872427 RepID=UPI0025BCD9E5|nr:dienelactone hydrolase family protein [Alcanivorax sp.]MED5240156.1 dienelactone hydrolase family protein [Pseudomonadota bacterium]MEE3319319.1 dienelactone hydrolase family protein [Pseudomonadota bacterium]